LTNDFFVGLLDMGTTWKATSDAGETFEGRDRTSAARDPSAPSRRTPPHPGFLGEHVSRAC